MEKPKKLATVTSLEERRRSVPSMIVVKEREPSCWPHHLAIDGKTKLASCRKCEKVFLPWDALMIIVRSWDNYEANRNALREEVTHLEKERDALKAQVSRLRSMRKRSDVVAQAKKEIVAGLKSLAAGMKLADSAKLAHRMAEYVEDWESAKQEGSE